MTRKELVSKLSELSAEMDNFLGDSSLLAAVRDFRELHGRLDEIIGEVEDEGVDELAEEESDAKS